MYPNINTVLFITVSFYNLSIRNSFSRKYQTPDFAL